MVDTGLNKSYQAKKYVPMDFSPIPKGDYKARIKEITPWKGEIKKGIKIYMKDEKGKNVLNEKGEKVVAETLPEVTIYNATVKFEILDGEFAGRLVFYNITTHPNMDYTVPALLDGLGLTDVLASEVQIKCLAHNCIIGVDVETYDKKVIDKDTGIETKVPTQVNRVKSFKQIPNVATNNETESNLGI